jgi:amino acid adenylation domain-containing protein
VLADSSARALLDGLFSGGLAGRVPVASIDVTGFEGDGYSTIFSGADAAEFSSEPLPSRRSIADVAHILFTSGSTGVPKGVPITHSNAIHFVEWAVGYFGITPSDKNSGHPPLHFDLSTFDIYGSFAAGAELHLVPGELNLHPRRLAGFMSDSELTQWFSVPSTLTLMAQFDVLAAQELPSRRRLLWCGEVLPTPTLIYWMRHLPEVAFTNLYGPTEATIASSYYTVPGCPSSETASVPIGTACEGEELLVLDERQQPSESGEIYIAGVGLSPGYWRDVERTRAVFLPNPHSSVPGARMYRTGDLGRVGDDGLVHFLGRTDSQIKSRGYRIELGEIEAALNGLGGLAECAVVGVPAEGFEGTTICCAYTSRPGTPIDPPRLRRELASVLPGYMLPARWLGLDALPKNANGKIDRRRIRELFEAESNRGRRTNSPVADG